MAAPTDNSISGSSTNVSDLTGDWTGEGVIIDIGTGDGRFVYQGFEITERGSLPASEWPEFDTSWAKRLQQNEQRPITYLIARAV